MNKVSGFQTDFAFFREEGTRVAIGYGLTAAGENMYEWREVYLPKKQASQITPDVVKQAVLADINARVATRILSGLTWNDKPVWLSTENQHNWKAAYDRALQADGTTLPVKFKLGETEDGTPVYHTFTSLNAFGDFTDAWQQHIRQCLADGWAEKDAIDWTPYQTAPTA